MEMKNYKKKLTINIRGLPWTFYLFDPELYLTEVGDGSRAEAEVEKHEVYYREDYLTLPIIRHELGHVMIETYSHYNVSYKEDQMEEILCSIFEYYFEYIDDLSKLILKKFKNGKRK